MTLGRAYMNTARLQLRPPAQSDIPHLAEILNDFRISGWLGNVPYPYGRKDAEQFIVTNEKNSGQVWMIHDTAGLIGMVGTVGELGYWLAPRAWKHDYASEAAQAATQAYFAAPDAHDLRAGYFTGNTRSASVLHRLGFEHVQTNRKYCRARGEHLLHEAMLLTHDRWATRH
ncbi:hypothetical protein BFP70_16655 [Thioclava sp. SK-1]|nr:hypothetical protein BFP70_16655 [Thioclava sp. SK-1]